MKNKKNILIIISLILTISKFMDHIDTIFAIRMERKLQGAVN